MRGAIMKRFKDILLICDERGIHDALVARAIELAKKNGASITLVDIVESAPGELSRMFGLLPGAKPRDIEAEVVTFHSARLAKIGAPIRSAGIEIRQQVLQGIGFVEIIRKVLRDGHDLVMKGSAGGREPSSPFFASTDLHLLRKCPCPVWIMNPSEQSHYSRVLAAVDPDIDDRQTDGLNRLIMDLATSLSDADSSELNVVSAWWLDEEDTLRHSGFVRIGKDDVDLIVEERRAEAERNLNVLLSDYPDTASTRRVHLIKGQARTVIPDIAEQRKAELIVMGTVGRTGIQGLIIGNTAEAILGRVACSILAVKPPGFVSPILLDAQTEADAATEMNHAT